MRHALTLHPACRCEAVTAIEVEIVRQSPQRLGLTYRLSGDLGRLILPAPAAPERTDGLWEHTCFEAFVSAGPLAYREFNFAPSTRWAAYAFDDDRQGMRPLEGITPPAVTASIREGLLEVRAGLDAPAGARLGLTAVIEEAGGRVSYWALAHPPGDPDFHAAAGRVLEV